MEELSGLITGGLGLPACRGLITARFHLIGCSIEVVVKVPGVSGGSIPFLPGQIHDFYRPVDSPYQVPYTFPLPTDKKKIPVTIRITFMGKITEKNYMVNQKRRDIIVNVLNLINRIKDKMSVTVTGIKRVPARITAYVKNLRNNEDGE